MNKKNNIQEDFLNKYINREMSENAPEGFTSRVMAGIRLENVPLKTQNNPRGLKIVPLVSAIVIAILVLLAYFLSDKNNLIALPELRPLKNFKLTIPDFDLSSVFSVDLTSIVIYILSGILLLSLFDVALKEFFSRNDNKSLQGK